MQLGSTRLRATVASSVPEALKGTCECIQAGHSARAHDQPRAETLAGDHQVRFANHDFRVPDRRSTHLVPAGTGTRLLPARCGRDDLYCVTRLHALQFPARPGHHLAVACDRNAAARRAPNRDDVGDGGTLTKVGRLSVHRRSRHGVPAEAYVARSARNGSITSGTLPPRRIAHTASAVIGARRIPFL